MGLLLPNKIKSIHLEKVNLYKLRNQYLSHQECFSREPVVKALYIIHNIPVEMQILGGNIELYMSAKGYTNYKVGLQMSPLLDTLSEKKQASRLGACIHPKRIIFSLLSFH